MAERDDLLAGPVARARGLRAARKGTCVHALMRRSRGPARDVRRGAPHRARDRAARRRPACGPDALARPRRRRPPRRRPRSRPAVSPRRASALVRISQQLDLERAGDRSARRRGELLLRERQTRPWSVATFFLCGLGRYDRGLVGDLGLIRCAASSSAAGPRRRTRPSSWPATASGPASPRSTCCARRAAPHTGAPRGDGAPGQRRTHA